MPCVAPEPIPDYNATFETVTEWFKRVLQINADNHAKYAACYVTHEDLVNAVKRRQ